MCKSCTLLAAEIPTAMFLAAPAIALANGASKPMGHTAPPQDPTSQETKKDVDEAMKKVKEAMMAIEARVLVPEVQVPVAAIRAHQRHDQGTQCVCGVMHL